jgi:hypothetical protein
MSLNTLTLSFRTQGDKRVKRLHLKTWWKAQAEVKLVTRRSSSVGIKPLEMALNTSRWTAVASRNRATLSFPSLSTRCFAGTSAPKSATCTCLTSRQGRGRGREEIKTRRAYGKRLFEEVDGSPAVGRFRSPLLQCQSNSSLEMASYSAIRHFSTNNSIRSQELLF